MSCATVNYATSENEASATQGAGGALRHLGPDDVISSNDPAFATAEVIYDEDQEFRFKTDSVGDRGLSVTLLDTTVENEATNNYPDLWGTADFEFTDDTYTVSLDGEDGIFVDSAGPFTYVNGTDQFRFVRNSAGKIEFYQNVTLRLTSTNAAPNSLRLNIWLKEYDATADPDGASGVKEVQYCGPDTVPGSRLYCGSIESE